MPIRFRCAYCNQLLGIAHRKSGTVVRCPTCNGKVVVPAPPAMPAAAERPLGSQPELIFERSDFDELLGPADGKGASPNPKDQVLTAASLPDIPDEFPPAPGPAGLLPRDGERLQLAPVGPTGAPRGILLSPAKATVLTVAVVAGALALFVIGLFVGMWIRS
jgi:DNA-directed RNA polymerase subunit RPC12/RpoP